MYCTLVKVPFRFQKLLTLLIGLHTDSSSMPCIRGSERNADVQDLRPGGFDLKDSAHPNPFELISGILIKQVGSTLGWCWAAVEAADLKIIDT